MWLPQGVDEARRLPGRFDLETVNSNFSKNEVSIEPGREVRVLAQLHSEFPIVQILDGGAADLEFILRTEKGEIFFSGSIPFKRESIVTTRWKIDFTRKG